MTVSAAKVLARQKATNGRDGMYTACLFLINELTGTTGPGWTVVECDDTVTRVSGTFAGTNWASGSGPPPAGSWCVLETLDANNDKHCQMIFHLLSETTTNLKIIPLQDFATGGSSTGGSAPTLPSTAFGAGTSYVAFSHFNVANNISCIADEGMCALISSHGYNSLISWTYMGEVTPFHSASGDLRAYTIWDRDDLLYWSVSGGSSNFNRLSPLDNETILIEGFPWLFTKTVVDSPIVATTRLNKLGDQIWPVPIGFADDGHLHEMGILRNVFTTSKDAGLEGTMGLGGVPSFYFFNESLGIGGSIVFTWDGITRI